MPTDQATPSDPPHVQAHWEDRAADRVLSTSRDQLLERSRHIVEVAYHLVSEAGLEALTMRTLLDRTGLSRRAFYERFASKDDLVLAVFEEAIRRAAQQFQHEVARYPAPLDRLQLIIKGMVYGRELTDSRRMPRTRWAAAIIREHLRLAQSRPEDLQAALQPLIALLAEQIAAGSEAGAIRHGDPLRLATLVYNLVATTVHMELLQGSGAYGEPSYQKQLAADVWEFCRRALVP